MADSRIVPRNVDRLLTILADIAANWIVFLGQLGLPQARIQEIERDVPQGGRRSVECLRAGLLQWLSLSDSPTYATIIATLKGPVLGETTLAQSVEAFANSEHN